MDILQKNITGSKPTETKIEITRRTKRLSICIMLYVDNRYIMCMEDRTAVETAVFVWTLDRIIDGIIMYLGHGRDLMKNH